MRSNFVVRNPECFSELDHPHMTLKDAKEEAERRVLVQAMDRAKFNLTLTAKMLGVSRVTLYNLLKKHDLKD